MVTTAAAAGELLAAAVADKLAVIDAYVAPVKLSADRKVLPGNLRELIRSTGPTVALPAAPMPSKRQNEASSWPDVFRPSTASPHAG